MRLRHIEVFHAIFTTGSITNAARLLHVSQPSVSKVLAHAEMQLGFQLFNRVKGRLIPTPEAEVLFVEVDRIFNQKETIDTLAKNLLVSQTGHLGLAVTPALGFAVIPAVTGLFQSQHSHVKVDVQTLHNYDLLDHMLRQRSDLAILFDPLDIDDTHRFEFGMSRMVAVLPNQPNYPSAEVLDLQEMMQYPYISIHLSGPLGERVAQYLVEQGALELDAVVRVDTYYIGLNMVRQGMGWCIIDEFTAQGNLHPDLRYAALEPAIEFPLVGLAPKRQPISRLTERYIELVQEHVQNMSSLPADIT